MNATRFERLQCNEKLCQPFWVLTLLAIQLVPISKDRERKPTTPCAAALLKRCGSDHCKASSKSD